MNTFITHVFLCFTLLLCFACNSQKKNVGTDLDPQIVFSDSTKLFFETVGSQYENSLGSAVTINKTTGTFSLTYPYHSTPRFLAQPIANCKKNSSCACNLKGCFRLDLSVLPCQIQLTGKIIAVFAAPVYPGYSSQINLENTTVSLTYSDSFVEKSNAEAFGSYPEQQKYYCENLTSQLKAHSENLKSTFDNNTLSLFPGPDLGLIVQVKKVSIPDENSYFRK